MTCEEKKAWLWRYREAKKILQQLSYRLEETRTAASHTTQNFSPAPGGNGDGQSLARAVERTDDLERQMSFQLAECDALFEEIDAALEQLEDFREYHILKDYYLNSKTWEQIADGQNVSVRWIHELRRHAINQLKI